MEKEMKEVEREREGKNNDAEGKKKMCGEIFFDFFSSFFCFCFCLQGKSDRSEGDKKLLI